MLQTELPFSVVMSWNQWLFAGLALSDVVASFMDGDQRHSQALMEQKSCETLSCSDGCEVRDLWQARVFLMNPQQNINKLETPFGKVKHLCRWFCLWHFMAWYPNSDRQPWIPPDDLSASAIDFGSVFVLPLGRRVLVLGSCLWFLMFWFPQVCVWHGLCTFFFHSTGLWQVKRFMHISYHIISYHIISYHIIQNVNTEYLFL